jgi:protein-S-isoprenylcysteine O-methyltransferase Ste14
LCPSRDLPGSGACLNPFRKLQEAPLIAQRLAVRAIIAFLALPGVVAFAVPLLGLRPDERVSFAPVGIPVLLIGCAVLGWCVRDFFVSGRGTLAPWDPPRRLVRNGLYRYSRNPMYVGVLLITTGWAIGFGSWTIAGYTVVLLAGFHLRVLLHEEPWLARTFGAEWTKYRAQVPRWLVRTGRGQSVS